MLETGRRRAPGARRTGPSMTELTAHPIDALSGTLRVPGDKSISHRALILGAIAEGPSEIRGVLDGEDCLATLRALEASRAAG